jgi:hypothetical protein
VKRDHGELGAVPLRASAAGPAEHGPPGPAPSGPPALTQPIRADDDGGTDHDEGSRRSVERKADDYAGIYIGRIRADGEVYNHAGVHVGRARQDA